MKKKYILITGIIVGLLAGNGIQIFASDAIRHITAAVNETFQIKVDGEKTDLPDEYELLIYNNRSYLPLRAVADMVGADIFWNDEDQTIEINRSNENCDKIDTTNSGKLPQSVETLDFKITARVLMKDNVEGTRLYLTLKNKGDRVLRLDQDSTVFESGGKQYSYSAVDNLNYDLRWYTCYLEKNEEAEGYLRIPDELVGQNNVKITLNLTQDGISEPISVTFRLAEC